MYTFSNHCVKLFVISYNQMLQQDVNFYARYCLNESLLFNHMQNLIYKYSLGIPSILLYAHQKVGLQKYSKVHAWIKQSIQRLLFKNDSSFLSHLHFHALTWPEDIFFVVIIYPIVTVLHGNYNDHNGALLWFVTCFT